MTMQNRLFQPIMIGPREARNRIVFGAHTTNFAEHNLLSKQHADYYAARAAGGVGMVVLEEHIVHPSDLPYAYAVLGYLPGTPVATGTVVERIHAQGSLALVQLNHNGQQSTGDHSQREMWAPSAVPDVSSREVPKVMELADMRAVIEGFTLVAKHAVQAESDGVELQVADRSLLRQFLSPLTNQRTGEYGGSLENRLRFLQETIEAVDAALGTDRVLGLRLCADELAPWAGLTPEQSIEIARLLVETGRVDYLTITMGSILSTQMFPFHASMHTPPGYATQLAAAIRQGVMNHAPTVPVFAAGRIMNASQAERILAEEQADGVEMIRALIADPRLLDLSQADQINDVRPCIACNQGCQVRSVMNVKLSCAVNPDVVGTDDTWRAQGSRPHGTRINKGHISPHHPNQPRATTFGETPGTLDASEVNTHETVGPSNPAWGAGNERPSPIYRPMQRDASPFIIIGGGPAGMEAARTAAMRGRQVVLYEREATLGGTVVLAARGPGRRELQLITDYLQSQLEQLGVEIHLGVEVTASEILRGVYPRAQRRAQDDKLRAEAVLVATGAHTGRGQAPPLPYTNEDGQSSRVGAGLANVFDLFPEAGCCPASGKTAPAREGCGGVELAGGEIKDGASTNAALENIAGRELPHVTDVRHILRGEQIEGQRVVIIDETNSHGVLSVAELLATQGHTVEIVTEDWYVGRDLVATHDIVSWMSRVLAHNVVMTPHTSVVRIEPGRVIVSDRFVEGERAIVADAVVLGVYDQPSQDLYYALKGRVPRLFRAGDCVAPRRIEHAIQEGRQVGEQL
jgi:2,4-dienoyl-CoA reductase-like NADH-dependent reductase (Old Yellow Enzyme family)